MANYRIEHRGVALRILAAPGWVAGRLHLPVKARIQDYLDHAGPFLTLTEVSLGPDHDLPFMALQRSAVAAIVPPLGEGDGPAQETSPHQVSMLLGPQVIRGRLRTLPGVRVSDYLMHHHGFVRVEDAHVREQGAERPEAFPVIYVNCERVIGVAELEPIKG